MWKGTYMCKHLSVNISLVGVCNVCVLFVSTGWLSGVDRDPQQPAQMGNTQCSLYASDLLPWGYRAVMVLRVVCGLFGKLQKLLNERGGDLPFYRTRLWLHSCCWYSSNRDKGSWTHRKIATKKLHSFKKSELLSSLMELLVVRCWAREPTHQSRLTCTHVLEDWGRYFRAPVQSSVCDRVDIPQKRTRSTSKTHLNGMTECWGRHLQRVLSAGNSGLWIVFTTSQCEGPPYLRCWAESERSAIVLWLFGIYLVIRPFKSNGGMKALALLNLLLLAYFV